MIRFRLLRKLKGFSEDTFDISIGTYSPGEKLDGGVGYSDEVATGPGPMKTQAIAFSELYGDPEEATKKTESDINAAVRTVTRQLQDLNPKTVEEAHKAFDSLHQTNLIVKTDQPCILYIGSSIAPELDMWIPCMFYEADQDD